VAYNPNNAKDNERLQQSVTWSRTRLEDFREVRVAAIKEYCGTDYGGIESKSKKEGSIPINTLYQFITVYLRNIISQNPECMMSTKNPEKKAYVKNLEINVNKKAFDMNVVRAFQEVLLDSFFGLGACKIGLDENGMLFMKPVYFDDHIHDMNSHNLTDMRYMGNYYRVPFDFVMDSKLFKNKNNLLEDNNSHLRDDGIERADLITRGSDYPGEAERTISLLDLFIPGKDKSYLVTFPKRGTWKKPLRIIEWHGPKCGPYKYLYFQTVPANAMPIAPVSNLLPLHHAIQQLAGKLIKQGLRQKSNLPYEPIDAEAAEAVVKAEDGEAFKSKNAASLKEVRWGGIDQQNFGFLIQLMEIFNEQAGNLRLIAGAGAESETFSQDQMLARAASQGLADMRDKFLDFCKDVYKDISWYEVNTPGIERRLTKKVDSIIGEIPFTYRSDEMYGLDLEFDVDIDPISTVHKSPEMRLAAMENFVQSTLPLQPFMQQQGITFDVEGYMRAKARYLGMTELEDLIKFAAPVEPSAQEGGGQPNETTRNYVRKNESGRSTAGRKQDMITQLMGGKVQDSQQGIGG